MITHRITESGMNKWLSRLHIHRLTEYRLLIGILLLLVLISFIILVLLLLLVFIASIILLLLHNY